MQRYLHPAKAGTGAVLARRRRGAEVQVPAGFGSPDTQRSEGTGTWVKLGKPAKAPAFPHHANPRSHGPRPGGPTESSPARERWVRAPRWKKPRKGRQNPHHSQDSPSPQTQPPWDRDRDRDRVRVQTACSTVFSIPMAIPIPIPTRATKAAAHTEPQPTQHHPTQEGVPRRAAEIAENCEGTPRS
jgi:hypothetical protein